MVAGAKMSLCIRIVLLRKSVLAKHTAEWGLSGVILDDMMKMFSIVSTKSRQIQAICFFWYIWLAQTNHREI